MLGIISNFILISYDVYFKYPVQFKYTIASFYVKLLLLYQQ